MSPSQIRNFAIIAHIDSGKTTLTDRFLEITASVTPHHFHDRLLDAHPIEQARGVTIKLAPVTMTYELPATRYTLNLIDTPGHVDFSYEVNRSLAACEGAILLIDGTRGIQAQTLAHARTALNLGLTLIPVINKIDLNSTNVPQCLNQLRAVFNFTPDKVSLVSAKTGQGVTQLLSRVTTDIPAPASIGGSPSEAPLRALIFNSVYHDHLGVIAFVRIVDGSLSPNLPLTTLQTRQFFIPKEIGIFTPQRQPCLSLAAGQVGYVATGLKDPRLLHIGDTLTLKPTANDQRQKTTPLPGYYPPQPVVFIDAYPAPPTTFSLASSAVAKLRLSDSSLTVKAIHSPALGAGLHLGFLGLFHIDIARERLEQDYHLSLFITPPTVEYHLILTNSKTLTLTSPAQFPDPATITAIKEPWVALTLLTPPAYLGALTQLLHHHRATYITTTNLGDQVQLLYHLPLAELIRQLADQIKSVSQGYASFSYTPLPPQAADVVKLDFLIHHQPVAALARLVVRDQAPQLARSLVAQLKHLLPAHQFAIPIQAVIGSQVIARETKPAFRKDVTAKLYGGDQTRKDKLLKKQKLGKKLLAQTGQVQVPPSLLTHLSRFS